MTKKAMQYLREHKLVEGRANNLYVSAEVAQSAKDEVQYIKNKAFDAQ